MRSRSGTMWPIYQAIKVYNRIRSNIKSADCLNTFKANLHVTYSITQQILHNEVLNLNCNNEYKTTHIYIKSHSALIHKTLDNNTINKNYQIHRNNGNICSTKTHKIKKYN